MIPEVEKKNTGTEANINCSDKGARFLPLTAPGEKEEHPIFLQVLKIQSESSYI